MNSTPPSRVRCPGCGTDLMRVKHADPAGAPDCRALLNELLARERSDLRRMRVHALTIDAWTVQHADHASAESVTAVGVHLVSLYSQWVLGLPYRAAKQIRREAAATIDFRRLPPPESFGELTVEHALGAQTPDQHIERVRQWAGSVWHAWHPHHDQVMSWTRRILGHGRVAEPPQQGGLGWYAGARNAVHPTARTRPPAE